MEVNAPVPLRAAVKVSAADLLQTYGHGSLQQMSSIRGYGTQGNKSKLAETLAKTLYRPERIAAALKALTEVERHVLDRLILVGGEVATAVLRDQLEAEDAIAPRPQSGWGASEGSYRKQGSRKFEDIIARLGALGLMFTREARATKVELSRPGHILYIPDAILAHLPTVDLPVETAPPPAEEHRAPVEALLRDTYLFAGAAHDRPIPLTTKGQIPKRSFGQLNALLRIREDISAAKSEADLGRLPLLRALLEDLEVLELGAGQAAKGGKPPGASPPPTVLRVGNGAAPFFSNRRETRWRQLYEAYRKTTRWSEISRLEDLTIRPRERITGPGVAVARQRVLAELSDLPVRVWIPIAHLVARVRTRAFEFLLPRVQEAQLQYPYHYGYYSSWDPYSGQNNLGLTFQRPNFKPVNWDAVEGGFIRAVVEALTWLGMLDTGGADAEVSASGVFRITEEAGVLLRGELLAAQPAAPNVVIQPNFQVFAFEPTGEDVLFTLERVAERIRAEQVVEYRLTRESVYKAQRDGMEMASILAFLDRVSTAPIPQNVRRSIEDWGRQMERIVVRRGTALLQAADPLDLDQLYADPALCPRLGKRLGPTSALVASEHLGTLSDLLIRGTTTHPLPALSEGRDVGLQPAIWISPEGEISFRQRVPSMFVLHALRPFTDETKTGMTLTPASLRRGAKTLTPEEIVAMLERLQGVPPPDEVAALVRKYAKNWGRGALAEIAILQVESPEILADILSDAELRPYVQPLAGASIVAAIQTEHVGRVRDTLAERGMELDGGLVTEKVPAKRRVRLKGEGEIDRLA